jgi:glycosyltransferase involved in cell wall biosynthesis
LSREKGQSHLIRAFAEARNRVPCQLAILGSEELENELNQLASELEIDSYVYFLGWQPNPFEFMARATVFVSTSLTEGFGLALLEAMACRIPVIATDCPGGQREIIAPDGTTECGLLVPAGSEADLAAAIVRMLTDSKMRERYVDAGLRRVRDYDPAIFQERYRNLFSSVGR